MARFLRRSPDNASEHSSTSETVDPPTSEPADPPKRTSRRGRGRGRGAAKAATAATETTATSSDRGAAESAPSPRSDRARAASRSPQAPAPAPPPAATKSAEAPKRKRAPRRAKQDAPAKQGATAQQGATAKQGGTAKQGATAKPAAASDGESDIAQLLRQQAELMEKQTALLGSLLEAQKQEGRHIEELVRRRAPLESDGDGLSLALKPRLAVFVDVPNILYGAERSGVTLDWAKVANFLSRGRTLVRAVAYAPISDDPSARQENERFVVPFLDKGYRIVTKPLKRFAGGSVKANFDVELAIDILTMADRLDVIALASGDGDFRRLVEIVGSQGVRVEVIAFGHSTSDDLRAAADRYIDIAAYIPELSA